MVKTLTKQEKEDIIYSLDQAIANNAIEGMVTTPEERTFLIELETKEASGELTKEEADKILYEEIMRRRNSKK